MPHIKHLLATTALAVPLAFGTASADAANIVDELKDSDQFSRFVEAIEAAEMEDTLEGDGPFTVFAPTNDAFDELPEGVRDALLEGDNKDTLEKLLKAHVVEGEELKESDIKDKDEQQAKVEPMEGDELSIDASGDDVRVSFAGRDDDEEGSDREQQAVVVPSTGATSGTGATGTGGGTGGATGMTGQPSTGGTGGQSMAGSPGGTAGSTTGGAAGMAGQQPGTAGTAGTGAPSSTVVTTTPGAQEEEDDGEKIGAREAKVVEADIEADNGVIHAIDAVLVPEDLQEDLRDMREEG